MNIKTKFFYALIAFLIFASIANAQTVPVKPLKVITPKEVSIKDTTIKSVVYPLYVGKNGGRFIIVTSKAGNQYKKYFKH